MNTREIVPLRQSVDLELTLPGSKSITNRAFLCAALASGRSRIFGALTSDDTEVMRRALTILGISISESDSVISIIGAGGQFNAEDVTLDLHNAGTATRFLTALMPLRKGVTIITGDQRMQQRPIADLVDGLRQLGADVEYLGTAGCPPIRIAPLPGNAAASEYTVDIPGNRSSQYSSALLMMAPLLNRPLRLRVQGELVSKPYIDITVGVMNAFGVVVDNHDYRQFRVRPQRYCAVDYHVEGDASAATYFSAVQHLHGGNVRFKNLDPSTSIQGDADFTAALPRLGMGDIDMQAMPDAAMTLAITAPFTAGRTRIRGIANLRIKETDRLTALETELKKISAVVRAESDGIVVDGPIALTGSEAIADTLINTYNDHRMAMCFAVVGTRVPGVVIENPECTQKTYPQFFADFEHTYLEPLTLADRHLILIGMRGAGKSYLGEKIAAITRRRFVDLDVEIEHDQDNEIPEIVADKGWDYFRSIESELCLPAERSTRSVFARYPGPLVIATGGGVVLREGNMVNLRKNAILVFIFADIYAIVKRLQNAAYRPPLKPGKSLLDETSEVWRERRPLYLKYADRVWDNTSGHTIEQSLPRIFGPFGSHR